MGRATDPGENHDPGNDQRFTPSLTQEPRLENGLGGKPSFADARASGRVAPEPADSVVVAAMQGIAHQLG
jgi:hypothetical protein